MTIKKKKGFSAYTQIVSLYSLQFGVSEAQAKRLILELSNMILLNLKEGGGVVDIPRLGVFSLSPGDSLTPDQSPIEFKPSHFALKFLASSESTKIDESAMGLENTINPEAQDYLNKVHPVVAETETEAETEKDFEKSLSQDEPGVVEIDEILLKDCINAVALPLRPIRRPNRPDPVRKSFLEYLKWNYALKESWTHPNGKVYEYVNVSQCLSQYKALNKHNYRALWVRWTSDQSREFIADHFGFSSSSIKRRWDESISTILVMLEFPEHTPEQIVKLYGEQ